MSGRLPSLCWLPALYLITILLECIVSFLCLFGSPSYQFTVFNPGEVFDTLYLDICSRASQKVSLNNYVKRPSLTLSDFTNLIRREMIEKFALIGSGTTAVAAHRQVLASLGTSLADKHSDDTCFCCISRRPQFGLLCGHSVCENCVRVFGHNSETDPWVFRLESCFICSEYAGVSIRVKPSTAGIRILSIDGGGTRGIAPLEFIQTLQDRIALPNYPVQCNFDVVYGTSSGTPPPFL